MSVLRVLGMVEVVIVLGGFEAPPSLAQEPQSEASFADIVRNDPPDVQAQKITTLAESGVVFAEQTLPEAFDLLQTGKALNAYMDAFQEPLSATRIQALQRLLKSEKDAQARFRAAALLYRYGNGAGTSFLLDKLAQGDLQSGLIMAMNREPGTEQQVADAILENQGRTDEILAAASRLLTDQQRRSILTTLKNSHWQTPRAVALPLLATEDDHALLAQEFAAYSDDASSKYAYAAALARMGDEHAIGFLKDQLKRVGTADQLSMRYLLFQSVAATGDPSFVSDLQQVLARCTSNVQDESHQQLRRRQENILNAFEAIANLDGGMPDDLIASTFAAFRASKNPRMITAFLRCKSELARTFIRARIGDEELNRVETLLALKQIPQDYLPRESKQWATVR